ncbi:MAG: hypothetical protein HC783_11690 [Rhodobacteraceae bacterium]|nr:hypothetical protein [Paracoccaceae bacterium]
MTAFHSARACGVVISGAALALSAVLVFGQGTSAPQIIAPECSSCDAWHARLMQLRPAVTEATE